MDMFLEYPDLPETTIEILTDINSNLETIISQLSSIYVLLTAAIVILALWKLFTRVFHL